MCEKYILILILFLFGVNSLSQDSIVYYHNDTVLGRTLYDGYFENHYNAKDSLLYSCEKLNDTWYYYRADTVYQKIEWRYNGHELSILNNSEWVPHINCVIYDTPTNYSLKLSNDVILFSKDNTAFIRSDKEIEVIKVYNVSGKLIKILEPYSNYITIKFDKKEMLIFDIDNTIYKLLIQ